MLVVLYALLVSSFDGFSPVSDRGQRVEGGV
jgi:hypothetical protein